MKKKPSDLLVKKSEPVLREVALAVPPEEVGSKKVKSVLERMKKALHAENDGVAIAAPQIGEGLRIFMVRGAVLPHEEGEPEPEDLIFINPKIIKASKKTKMMEEGCLSLRWLYGEVLRHEKVTIEALDENGDKVRAGASGLLAQIFQHETDHLEGVLFIDKAENVRDLPPEESHD